MRKATVLVSFAAAAIGVASAFAPALPEGLPSPATLAGWEKVEGEVETTDSSVSYRFYVNPSRPGLYELTQYRMTRIVQGAGGARERRPETEKVLWNARPDEKHPLVCYEMRGGAWRRLEYGSAAYIAEMHTAIYVYSLHRQAVATRQ
jgi:hypothetical protein